MMVEITFNFNTKIPLNGARSYRLVRRPFVSDQVLRYISLGECNARRTLRAGDRGSL